MNEQTHSEAKRVPLRSVHSTSFPQLLEWFGLSVLVSTYQAGKLVFLRADGGVLTASRVSKETPGELRA